MNGVGVIGAAYLLGAIPFGLILGKLAGGTDVRRLGSGNIGATNVARSLGMGAGLLTLALDLGKGAAAVWLARRYAAETWVPSVAALAAVVGHIFPVYLRFRGGKGVATGCGAFLVLDPAGTLGAAGVFAAVVAVSRRVSLGSVVASAALPVILLLRGAPGPVSGTALASTVLIVYRHRENLRRILAGSEPRLGEGRG